MQANMQKSGKSYKAAEMATAKAEKAPAMKSHTRNHMGPTLQKAMQGKHK